MYQKLFNFETLILNGFIKTELLITKKNGNMIKTKIITCCLLVVLSLSLFAQNEDVKRDKALRIFFDCSSCDTDYIKEKISFVNYVRDRNDAQLHILITYENTGSGGQKQIFYFIGQQEFAGELDTLSFYLKADATSDETREKQVNILKLGLVRYVAKTPYAENLTILYKEEEEDKTEEVTDKWNSWFFEMNGSAYFNGEKSYKSFSSWSSINAQRVTEELKVELGMYYNFSENTYVFDDTTIISTTNSKSFHHLLVKSINDHWSFGYDIYLNSSLYQNLDFSTRLYPSIEYNIFPYSESNRKQIRILYGLGPKFYNYIDSTIYDKEEELLFAQKLGIAIKFKEKWGSVSTSIEGSNYFHDFKMKRLSLYTFVNLRLFKGLSLSLNAGASIIHDQLNLPKGDISSEDVLLRRKQLASQYSYWGNVGLSYSFGSIYNNVVNPRFGN